LIYECWQIVCVFIYVVHVYSFGAAAREPRRVFLFFPSFERASPNHVTIFYNKDPAVLPRQIDALFIKNALKRLI